MTPENASLAASLACLPPQQRREILDDLSPGDLLRLEFDWRFWARPNQIQPDGDWLTWLISAGRGFGKTRTGAETVREWAQSGQYSRIALVAETAADARDVLVEGESGILAISPPWFKPLYEPSKRRLTWPNGAVGTLYNGTEPDQLRGPQHDAAWVDELAKYASAQETWDQLQFGLRLGDNPKQVVTTTPRPIPLIRKLLKDSRTVVTRGRTMDNSANLAASFVRTITERYAGTRLGRQELNAELLDDVPGALWTRAMIDLAAPNGRIPDMARIVVAVDPSGTDGGEKGDEIGIVIAGRGVDGRAYVLADWSCRLSPDGWGRRVVDAYHKYKADRVIAERNFGGAMVEHVIRTADRSVSYAEVTASRGKTIRAEPISALYEQGRVTHAEPMPELETQMVHATQGGYLGEGSPDRMDAMVWALTELMLAETPPVPARRVQINFMGR